MAGIFAISSPDLVRAGTGGADFLVDGDLFKIRADIPCDFLFDGYPVTPDFIDSQQFQSNPSLNCFTVRKPAKRITVKLAAGWGSTGYAQAVGRYGLVVIEAVDTKSDAMRFENVDPRFLPTHCWTHVEDTGVAQFQVVQADYPLADWLINGKLPREVFITSVAVHQRESQIIPTNNPQYQLINGAVAATWLRQANGGASEREDLFAVAGVCPYTVSFPFMKFPLAALLSPWQAETPTIAVEMTENRTTHVQSQIIHQITGAVLY